jgi:hypothetical protein
MGGQLFGDSVTELDAATGALVKMIRGSSYGFDRPVSVSSDGKDVWVANYAGNTVTGFPRLVLAFGGSCWELEPHLCSRQRPAVTPRLPETGGG